MVSGGKDTACLLDLFSQPTLRQDVTLFHLKADVASGRLAKLFGFSEPLLATRTIDPTLVAVNKQGYFNGHTPFSAYLAFSGLLMAEILGKKNVVVANESSANEGSLVHNGLPINHQFSKGIIFEASFRAYSAETFNSSPQYFSAMRLLNEEEICAWFSKLSQAHAVFRSCNKAAKNDAWCGECPKCAFVALMLGSYLGEAGLVTIFGSNPLRHEACIANCLLLLRQGGDKPLDCVGTYQECQHALLRFQQKFPDCLPAALRNLTITPEATSISIPQHFIPANILSVIQNLVSAWILIIKIF